MSLLFCFFFWFANLIFITIRYISFLIWAFVFLQLGNGTFVMSSQPLHVVGLAGKPVVAVAAGASHSMVLTATNLYVFGANSNGQLGLGDLTTRLRPTLNKFFGRKRGRAINCGDFHSCYLTETGHIFGWGSSKWGQLGLGQPQEAVLGPCSLQEINNIGTVVSFSCGRRHTMVVVQTAPATTVVFTCGSNANKELGLAQDHPAYASKERHSPAMVRALEGSLIALACAGGHQSFAVTARSTSEPPRFPPTLLCLDADRVRGRPHPPFSL